MPLRSSTSRNGTFGLCQVESFRNSFPVLPARIDCDSYSLSGYQPAAYPTNEH